MRAAIIIVVCLLAAIPAAAGAGTATFEGGNNAVYAFTSASGTTELRLGTLGNGADKKWWRLLWNQSGDLEVQTCSDAGPCQSAANRFNITAAAQPTTLTANGIQMTHPSLSAIDSATGTDDATATVRSRISFPLEGLDGGGMAVSVRQNGGLLNRAFGVDNNGIFSTGDAAVNGLTRGAVSLAGPLALSVTTCPPSLSGQVRLCARADGTIAIAKPDGTTAVIATVP